MKIFAYLMLAITLITTWAWAEGREIPQNATVLSLDAEARIMVMPDTLAASLYVEKQSANAADVQAYINTKMQRFQRLAKAYPSVKFVTQNYNVRETWHYPVPSNRKLRNKQWTGRQSFTLKGEEFKEILKLAGELQKEDAAMNNMFYSMSRKLRDQHNEDLMSEALMNIQSRAKRFAKDLSKSKLHFASINVNHSNNQPRLYARKEMMMARAPVMETAAAPAPVAQADEMELSAHVNAQVWLQ